MIHGVRCVRQDVSYISKKHSCPICNTALSVIKVSKVVNGNSGEAKKIPPIIPGTVIGNRGTKFRKYTAVGNIKWNWKEFECPNCRRRFTVEQMKKIEASPKECWEEMVASIDESLKQTDENIFKTLTRDTGKGTKKSMKLAFGIAVPAIAIVLILIGIIVLSASKFIDPNGPDNFALAEITRDDILKLDNNYTSSVVSQKHSGFHTNIIGTRLRECDYDSISKSFGKLQGILILQATKITSNNLTLSINSFVESGNAEIIIVIEGEYYCSVDVNRNQLITLQDISNKEVIVKLAGEDAKMKVDVNRIY